MTTDINLKKDFGYRENLALYDKFMKGDSPVQTMFAIIIADEDLNDSGKKLDAYKKYCNLLIDFNEQTFPAHAAFIAGNIARETNSEEWKKIEIRGLKKEYEIRMALARDSGQAHFAETSKYLAKKFKDNALEIKAMKLEKELRKIA